VHEYDVQYVHNDRIPQKPKQLPSTQKEVPSHLQRQRTLLEAVNLELLRETSPRPYQVQLKERKALQRYRSRLQSNLPVRQQWEGTRLGPAFQRKSEQIPITFLQR
jgi:hypothetical protein